MVRLRRKRINRSAWCAIPAALVVGLVGPVLLIQALYGDPFSFFREVKGEFRSYRVEKRLTRESECFEYRFFAERDVVQRVLDREFPASGWKVYKFGVGEDGVVSWHKHDSSLKPENLTWAQYNRPNGESVQARYFDGYVDFIYIRPMKGGFAKFWEQVRDSFTRPK